MSKDQRKSRDYEWAYNNPLDETFQLNRSFARTCILTLSKKTIRTEKIITSRGPRTLLFFLHPEERFSTPKVYQVAMATNFLSPFGKMQIKLN